MMVALGTDRCVESGSGGGSSAETTTLCPQLSDLRLDFQWEITEVDGWKGRAAELVEKRGKLGIKLAVYASWKGEGTFLRLA